MEPCDQRAFDFLLAQGSDIDRARLRAVSLDGSGDWMGAVPFPWNRMSSRKVGTALCLRLGLPVFTSEHICPCGKDLCDQYGRHALICPIYGDRVQRHNTLRDVVIERSERAGLSPFREKSNLLPESHAKPGDVFLPSYVQGEPTAIDLVVSSPCTASAYRHAAQQQGYTVQRAEEAKDTKSYAVCAAQHIHFLGMAFETFGGLGKNAMSIVQRIGAMVAGKTGRSRAEEIQYFRQRLSLKLQRANAAMVHCRAEAHSQQYM